MDYGFRENDGCEADLWTAVKARRNAPPALERAEHDLDAVSPLESALVIFERGLALLSAQIASTYPFVSQCFPEPVGIVAAFPKQSFDIWKAARQRVCANFVAHLSSGEKQVERAPLAIADGVRFGVHVALGSTIQTITPPFLATTLVAVQCAFR